MPLDISPAVGGPPAVQSPPTSSPSQTGSAQDEAMLSKLPQQDAQFDPKTNPIFASIANADVPGVVFQPADAKNPDVAPLIANARSVIQNGLAAYGLKDGRKALFNPQVVKPEEVQALDKAGKLDQLLVPFARLGAAESAASPEQQESPNSEQPPATAGSGQGPAQVGPAEQMGPPMPSGASRQIAGARARSMASAGAPSPAAPAAGGILGRILKPVV